MPTNELQEIVEGSEGTPIPAVGGSATISIHGVIGAVVDTSGGSGGYILDIHYGGITNPMNVDSTSFADIASAWLTFAGAGSVSVDLGGGVYLLAKGTTSFGLTSITLNSGTGVSVRDAVLSAVVNWDDSAATIQTTLEGFDSIGSGNIAVSNVLDGDSNRIALDITFQGALAGTDVDEISVTSSLLQAAATISDATTQNGVADQASTPTLTSPFVSPVVAVTDIQEVQRITLSAVAFSGTLVINGQSCTSIDAGAIQTAIAIGTGYSCSVNTISGTDFDVTFPSSSGDISDSLLDFTGSDLADGDSNPISISAATSTQGVMGIVGVYQQDTLTFSPITPTYGNYDLTYNSGSPQTFSYSSTASDIEAWLQFHAASLSTVSGDTTSGFTLLLNDNGSYDSYTGVVSNYSSLAVLGQPQQVSFQLTDTPDRGSYDITIAGGSPLTEPYDTAASFIASTIGWSVVSGTDAGAGGPIVLQAPTNASNVSFAVTDNAGSPLRKPLSAEVVTLQDGDASTTDTGDGAGILQFTGSGSGSPVVNGAGAGTLQFLGAASGSPIDSASSTGLLQFIASGSGSPIVSGSGSGTIHILGSGHGSPIVTGSGSGSLRFIGSSGGSARKRLFYQQCLLVSSFK